MVSRDWERVHLVVDKLWGEIDLDHPVLEELLRCEPVQRLRGIAMAGASRYLFPERRINSRFEHSLGVMHILTVLGASLEERVAGLLHDIPHTAFSHTVDIVFPSSEHNYHEQFQREIVMHSEIPAILARHDIELRAAIEPHHFPLLEQPLPNLCADRIDYTLRDLHGANKISTEQANRFLAHLLPTPYGIVADSIEVALYFSRLFLEANDTFWTGPGEAGAYWALAGAIRRALQSGDLTRADLFSTDETAMNKLRSLDDPVVADYLNLLSPSTQFYEVEVMDNEPYFTTQMKQRTVDPYVLEQHHTTPKRLSHLSPDYAHLLRSRHETHRTAYRLWSPSISATLMESMER